MSRLTDSAGMLLPQPDSPTIASVSRGRNVNERLSTALIIPSRVKKYVRSPATSRMGRSARPSGRAPRSATALLTLDRSMSAAQPRIENVAQRVAEQIGAEYREADGDSGKAVQPRARAYIFGGGLRQHAAPGWIRLGDPETKERQRGFGEDRRAELGGCEHDQRCKGIGQDVPRRDAQLAHADGLRGLDEG